MIFRSPHAPLNISSLSLTDYVLSGLEVDGSKAALIDAATGYRINYDQLRSRIASLAAFFAKQGVSKGDVAAIYAPNSPQYVETFLALASLGAVTTMVPPLFTEMEALTQIRDSAARYLFTVPGLMDLAKSIATAANINQIFTMDVAGPEGNEKPNLVGYGAIEPAKDLVSLPYSSGTTGFPKGVMLTHTNLVALLQQLATMNAVTADDTLVCVVPMSHLYGLHVVADLALSKGATVVTLPRFALREFLSALEQYRVTVAPLVPPLVLTLSRAAEVDDYDLSSLKTIHCGAASLAPEIARACTERLGCDIRYGYGLTEASPLSHMTAALSTEDELGSVGYCLPNTECKIIEMSNGKELGPNQQGEICIRGPQVMKGYLGDPQATAEMIDPEGWLHTGDIGYADEDGRLFVVDRLKELIKYKGRQVAPAELEAILMSHPAVTDAAVIPSLDEESGEVPKAFVVLREAAEISAEEIMAFVAGRVAPHKRVRRIEFTREIPKNAAGKILRRVLIERDRGDVSN